MARPKKIVNENDLMWAPEPKKYKESLEIPVFHKRRLERAAEGYKQLYKLSHDTNAPTDVVAKINRLVSNLLK